METVLYQEKQPFPLVILFTLFLLILFVVSNAVEGEFAKVFTKIHFYLVLAVFISPFFFWGIMHTIVTGEGLDIRFGLLATKKISIQAADIRSVEPATLKWSKGFRWMGITHDTSGTVSGCFTWYGKGVTLRTGEGTVFIGSARADQLAAAIRKLKSQTKTG